MNSDTYQTKRGQLETYFDRTAVDAWSRLTSEDEKVGRIRATVRAGRNRMRQTLLGWLPGDLAGWRVLDAGCGTGVLALAALALGAGRAFAFDVDPLATEATAANAVANALHGRVAVWTGSFEALARGVRFDWVIANMIRSELLPLLPALAACVAPSGRVILSGLLEEEEDLVREALARDGLAVHGRRSLRDPTGDAWLALVAHRAAEGSPPPSA